MNIESGAVSTMQVAPKNAHPAHPPLPACIAVGNVFYNTSPCHNQRGAFNVDYAVIDSIDGDILFIEVLTDTYCAYTKYTSVWEFLDMYKALPQA